MKNSEKSFNSEQLGQFQPNWTQNNLKWRRFKFVQIKGHTSLKGEIKAK